MHSIERTVRPSRRQRYPRSHTVIDMKHLKESKTMNRRSTLLTIIAAVIFAFCLPGLAAAQNNEPWWGRDQRDQDQRDRDYRRNRDDDRYNRGRYNYDSRTLRNAVRELRDGTRR